MYHENKQKTNMHNLTGLPRPEVLSRCTLEAQYITTCIKSCTLSKSAASLFQTPRATSGRPRVKQQCIAHAMVVPRMHMGSMF